MIAASDSEDESELDDEVSEFAGELASGTNESMSVDSILLSASLSIT